MSIRMRPLDDASLHVALNRFMKGNPLYELLAKTHDAQRQKSKRDQRERQEIPPERFESAPLQLSRPGLRDESLDARHSWSLRRVGYLISNDLSGSCSRCAVWHPAHWAPSVMFAAAIFASSLACAAFSRSSAASWPFLAKVTASATFFSDQNVSILVKLPFSVAASFAMAS